MSESPIEELLGAMDGMDVEAVVALFEPEARLVSADGQRAEGTQAVREVISAFIATLRSTTHRITAQWHVDNAWIAEVDASYELRDWLQLNALPRAVVLREGPAGIADVRFYGAHEQQLSDHPTGGEGMWVGERWIPPL